MLKEIIAGYISFAAIAHIVKDNPVSKTLYDHEYERILKVNKNGIIIDVGAAKGSFILNNIGKVKMGIAIEPNPQYAKELSTYKKSKPNFRVIQKAAYNEKKTVKFRLNKYESAIMADNEVVINVEADTLDNILSDVYDSKKFKFGIDKIDFIKIDVEGSEIEALLGMKNTLEKTRKVVISAYHKRDGKPTYLWVEKFLRNRGFNVVVTDDMLVHAWKD